MAYAGIKYAMISTVCLLGACSRASGNWPNLSDPLPDTTERERAVSRAAPAEHIAPEPVDPHSPMTKSVAIKLVIAVKAEIEKARKIYLASKAAINHETKEDQEIAWHDTQAMLTRLSYTTERLDSVIYANQLKNAPVWENAQHMKNDVDGYVAKERQILRKLKP